MREITLSDKYRIRFENDFVNISEKDLGESIKSFTPGEWCLFVKDKKKYLGFVNPISTFKKNIYIFNSESVEPTSFIEEKIKRAISYRSGIGYGQSSRLIYGDSDCLPGIILDSYENAAILQINTAGMDKYRSQISEIVKSLCKATVYMLDNDKYRTAESLPVYEKEELPESIEILENEFKYHVDRELMQKIGYYYDHRENRRKFELLLNDMNNNYSRGVDLYTYVGSWGMHLLRHGLEYVDFVDQANMGDTVKNNIAINDLTNNGEFIRSDVFKFLDNAIEKSTKYDVIVCDPPAFTKSYKEKKSAIVGYEKLYTKIFKILESGGTLAAASCTQNISLSELDSCVQRSAVKNNVKIKLIDIGLQGRDHPMKSLDSKSNYIKYLAYKVEK